MKSLVKCLLFIAFLSSVGATSGFCEGPIRIKGYYQEDGAYVKPRLIDPIQKPEAFPRLSKELPVRIEQVSRYYEGKVVTAKVSFPASRKGIVLNGMGLGKTNVHLFRDVSKYGSAVDKGEKAIITKFKVGSKTIDIDLNAGGFGRFDSAWRILSDVLTLGLMELRDWDRIRAQKGSRLRIKLGNEDPVGIRAEDLDLESFRLALQKDGPANRLILENLEQKEGEAPSVHAENLAAALEKILGMPDFYQSVSLENSALPKEIAQLLEKAKSAAAKKPLKENEIRTLNLGLLRAAYPIRKSQDKFTSENLNFQNIDEYLSLVFEK